MPLNQFNFTDKDTRLIKYKSRVYKVKLQYRTPNGASDALLIMDQQEIQSELESAIRAIIAMQGDVHPFRTDHFVIHPERKYWNTASLLKFFDHGHELTGDPHMLNLIVEVIPEEARPDHNVERRKQQAKSQSEAEDRQEAGPSKGRTSRQEKSESAPRSANTRSKTRQTPSRSSHVTDSESASDVNTNSGPDRPHFHSPPRKHRRYVLRKRASSHSPPPSRRQPGRAAKRHHEVEDAEQYSNKRMSRYMDGGDSEYWVEEGGRRSHPPGPATPDNIQPHVAATASNAALPAHPQGGVILHEMLRPSPDEIDQHQLEEQMRLQRLAGPAAVNRSHAAFSAAEREPPRSAFKKIMDVVLTPAKRLFSHQ